eukprot:TRINITY_DN5002_c0_g1_i1.p1 TRINITY_DN5002_c0_g1~~TRINITY_DN5002_c0_g1_i1.p1  ORF type:complete len:513 (-),score=77.65 TRINITY_DN5002_c0_g1_i1:311-1849(-)
MEFEMKSAKIEVIGPSSSSGDRFCRDDFRTARSTQSRPPLNLGFNFASHARQPPPNANSFYKSPSANERTAFRPISQQSPSQQPQQPRKSFVPLGQSNLLESFLSPNHASAIRVDLRNVKSEPSAPTLSRSTIALRPPSPPPKTSEPTINSHTLHSTSSSSNFSNNQLKSPPATILGKRQLSPSHSRPPFSPPLARPFTSNFRSPQRATSSQFSSSPSPDENTQRAPLWARSQVRVVTIGDTREEVQPAANIDALVLASERAGRGDLPGNRPKQTRAVKLGELPEWIFRNSKGSGPSMVQPYNSQSVDNRELYKRELLHPDEDEEEEESEEDSSDSEAESPEIGPPPEGASSLYAQYMQTVSTATMEELHRSGYLEQQQVHTVETLPHINTFYEYPPPFLPQPVMQPMLPMNMGPMRPPVAPFAGEADSRFSTPVSYVQSAVWDDMVNPVAQKSRFVLAEQPSISQRKSYKKENRYLTPNPMVIAARPNLPEEPQERIIDGIVSVKLGIGLQ